MSRAIVRAAARRDIHNAADYIANDNPTAARRFYAAVDRTLDSLADPESGALYDVGPNLEGLRVWQVKGFKNYLVFYLPISDGIAVVRILHGARDIEQILAQE